MLLLKKNDGSISEEVRRVEKSLQGSILITFDFTKKVLLSDTNITVRQRMSLSFFSALI